ncbi:CAP domain-containing protein [candidate division KSB1 bacterium]|nr:CAP domain-containing protein [candidate division KSB1 bacterium]NIR69525.1 CAP domain-containing protein [candidate division KSB1 bacterium]NIS24293.1 CAP domain-containing protein [candidate division KSB1 bacterium]NIT71208.1 CAP domain-containing protein [candidate division KSB1 bacterium]NIU24912.1 CAP domain-containing protein [candidate division KSB1 bacterium]
MTRPIVVISCLLITISCGSKGTPPKYFTLPPGELSKQVDLTAPIRVDSVDLSLLEWAIFRETNYQRRRLGLTPFKFELRLRQAALSHTREMAELGYFDHFSPISRNKTVKKRLEQEGIEKGVGGENLAIHPINKRQEIVFRQVAPLESSPKYAWRNAGTNYTYEEFAEDLVKRWLNSPPHRRNIINRNFKYMGVACVQPELQESEVLYVTQNFSSKNY